MALFFMLYVRTIIILLASDDYGGAEVHSSAQDLALQGKLLAQNRSSFGAKNGK